MPKLVEKAKKAASKIPIIGGFTRDCLNAGEQLDNWRRKTFKDIAHGDFKAAAKNTGKSVSQSVHHLQKAVGQFGKTVKNDFENVKSAIAGEVAKCIASFFITKDIINWLAQHSMAATVFATDPAHLEDDSHLSDLVNNSPFGLIYTTNGSQQMFNQFISNASVIFCTIMMFLLILSVIMASGKLTKSSIFNAPEERREFMNRIVRFGAVVLILDFYPQIIQLVLQINGTILLSFQDLMMAWPIGSGKDQISLWYLCLHMGSTFTGMKDMFSSPGGFAFTLIFWLISLISGAWVFAYYIWREITFTILYILGYIQVPMLAFGQKYENHFHKWVKAMFGTIFIQSVHAFVLTIMALFFSVAQQQVTTSFLVDISKTLKNFGAMLMMGVILTMFQPISKAIAKQLDLDVDMVDFLNETASSSAQTLLPAAVKTEGAMLKAGFGLLTGTASLAAGAFGKGEGMVGRFLAKHEAGKKHGDPNVLAKARQRYHRGNNLVAKAKNGRKKAGGILAGALGNVADSFGSVAATQDQAARSGGRTFSPLRNLAQTNAGGRISSRLANRFGLNANELNDFGLRLADRLNNYHPEGNHFDDNQNIENGNRKTGNTDNAISKTKYNTDIDSQNAQNRNIRDVNSHDGSGSVADTNSIVNGNELDSIATTMAHTPLARSNDSGAVVSSMNAAKREAMNGSYDAGNVDIRDAYARFRNHMYSAGYSPAQVNKMMKEAGIPPMEFQDGDISRSMNPVNNSAYKNMVNTPSGQINSLDPLGNGYNVSTSIPAPDMQRPSSYAPNNSVSGMNTYPNYSNPRMTPSYLAKNLKTDGNGMPDPNALQVHVTNGASYIKANMADGSSQIVSSIGQGDPTLAANQEYVHPLQVDNGVGIRPYGDQGTMYTNGKPAYTSQPNLFANETISSYNSNGYVSPADMRTSAMPANSMVDKSQYTMDHLAAESGKYSNYMLKGNKDMSYISAYNNATNQWQRITPIKSGVGNLDQGVTFEKPINYSPHGFSMSPQAFKFTDNGPAPSGKDFNEVNDWLNDFRFNDYIRPTKPNESNYLSNHQGNLNINQADFYGDVE